MNMKRKIGGEGARISCGCYKLGDIYIYGCRQREKEREQRAESREGTDRDIKAAGERKGPGGGVVSNENHLEQLLR